MISPQDALRLVLEHAPALGPETAALARCVGRILAADLRAREALPPFDNSAMDGFAVRAHDLKNASRKTPIELTLREHVRAGAPRPVRLRPGEAARIMTGAPLPLGADSVVMQELALPGAPGRVKIPHAPQTGDHIRARGEDVAKGSLLLKKGTRLRPYEIALLAAQGIETISVVARPRVAVLASGDELVEISANLSHGKIRNSNGPALIAALSRWDIDAVDMGVAKDDPEALRSALASALDRADVVIVTGGVSVGDFDYTKSVLLSLGVHEIFWKVAIKPGKPLLFGTRERPGSPRALVFGLPGNPLAALVCLEEFVRPALEKLQGSTPGHQSYHLWGRTLNDYPKPKDRQQYVFCQAAPGPDGYELTVIRPQGSAMLAMASRANALALAPVGTAHVRRGTTLAFRWLK
ncbi:MAG: gephyrin-like molybdotransferase Glp [Elusimicrobiota bacterium]